MAKDQNFIRKMFFHFLTKNGKPMIIFCSWMIMFFCSFFAPCLALRSFSPTYPRKILIGWPESWIIRRFFSQIRYSCASNVFCRWPFMSNATNWRAKKNVSISLNLENRTNLSITFKIFKWERIKTRRSVSPF